MEKYASIQYLKDSIPEDAWSWVIPALRQDPLTWKSLQDPNLVNKAVKKWGPYPHRWTPMNIALVSLGADIKTEDLNTKSLAELSPTLNQQVNEAYERYKNSTSHENNIKLSGLIALYLSEHKDEITNRVPKTSLACLFSILPEPLPIFTRLQPDRVVHSILANPQKPDEQIDIFWKYLKEAGKDQKTKILRTLFIRRSTIAVRLAEELLNDWSSSTSRGNSEREDESQLELLETIISNAEVLSIANRFDMFSNHLDKALKMTETIQGNLTAKLIDKDISTGNLEDAFIRWKQVKTTLSPTQNANIFLHLISTNDERRALKWFKDHFSDDETGDAIYLLAKGFQAYLENNNDLAKKQLIESIAAFSLKKGAELTHLHHLTRLALKLQMPSEAKQAIDLALEIEPNDFTSIELLRECHLANDQILEAIDVAHLSLALNPDHLQSYRHLAETLEIGKQWSHALQVRSSIMSRHDSFQTKDAYQDAYNFAACSLKMNHPQNSAGICKRLLTIDPDDPDVHHLLGQTYRAMGDPKKAQEHFSEATRIAPDMSKSWLELADVYREKGNKLKQKETLQSASNIVTDDPEIFLLLGKIHLEESSPTQALQHFRTANELIKNGAISPTKKIDTQIALFLGRTLDQLGHHQESRDVLEKAYQADMDQMELAHAYARALLATKSPEDALPILLETRRKVPASIDLNLDFARACLATTSNLDETTDTLNDILNQNPDHAEAKVLLAEAYKANDELDLSIQRYEESLESPIREDPDWSTRLSLGLSEVYLQKNKPENAIAILNSGLQNTNDEKEILKSLSNAYHAANLREKAIWAAKSVFDLNPNDENNLDWFTQQAINLGATKKAIDVLEEKKSCDSVVASHIIKLGWLYAYEGDYVKASQTFSEIKNIEQVSPTDLLQASKGLIAVKDIPTAIELIDKGIHLCNSIGNPSLIPELLFAKIDGHQKTASIDLALETLETAIEISPNDPVLLTKKAELLLELQAMQDAIKCIEDGLLRFPNDIDLQVQAAKVYRANGQLIEASTHTRDVIDLIERSNDIEVDVNALTTMIDLSDALLQQKWINEVIHLENQHPQPVEPGMEHYHCFLGEIALEIEEENQAEECLKAAIEVNPNHPRTLALKARIKTRKEDYKTGETTFQQALKTLGNYPNEISLPNKKYSERPMGVPDFQASTYIAVAKASAEFNEWQTTNVLLKKALEISPEEPRSQFLYARTLVMRAEYQRLCKTVDVVTHAPGESALANFAYKEFETAILKAAHIIAKLSEQITHQDYDQVKENIAMWLARGQAVFQPSIEHAKAVRKLPADPSNLASYISTLRECGDYTEAQKLAQELIDNADKEITNAHLLAQIALTLSEQSQEIAMDASQKAVEVSKWHKLTEHPIFFAVAAKVAGQIQKTQHQKEYLRNAVKIWGNEPIWLLSIADLHLESDQRDEFEDAIVYLEKAIHLDPSNIEYYLKLGEAHQLLGNPKGKIIVLDQATRVVPNQPELWMALSKAYHENSDIPKAIRAANTVLQLNPRFHEASLLLAETSLEVNNPKKAAGYIESVLSDDPGNMSALMMSTEIYSILNKPEKALESIEKVLPALSDSIPLQLKRIQLVQESKGPKEALDILEKLDQEHPKSPQLLASIAEIYSNLNQPEHAIQKAQQALVSTDEELSKNEYLATLTLLGRLLRKTGHLDQSIHYLNEAIEKDPKNAAPFVELGRCYQEQRIFDRALQHYQNAIQLSPENFQPYYFAGLVLKENKDYVNAEKMFKSASKLAPRNMNIYRQLAAVTAINFVQTHHNRSQVDDPISIAVPVERKEK